MQIVIKLSKEQYDALCMKGVVVLENQLPSFLYALRRGIVLPKGHGRLKDIDEIKWYGCTSEDDCPYKNRDCKDCNRAECSKTQVDSIPVLIPADNGGKDGSIDLHTRK